MVSGTWAGSAPASNVTLSNVTLSDVTLSEREAADLRPKLRPFGRCVPSGCQPARRTSHRSRLTPHCYVVRFIARQAKPGAEQGGHFFPRNPRGKQPICGGAGLVAVGRLGGGRRAFDHHGALAPHRL